MSRRNIWCHKHDFGYLLVIAGSYKFTGSGIFNCEAALRSGCDLTTLIAPKRAADIAAIRRPDIITIPLKTDYLGEKDVNIILPEIRKYDTLLIGSGLGRREETFKAVRSIVESAIRMNKPIVLDADGLRAFKNHLDIFMNRTNKESTIILTPNSREFEELSDTKLSTDIKKRINTAKEFAKRLNIILLLKGHFDIITDGVEVLVNKSGSVFMTKGGFGDLLSGIVASLIAQHIQPMRAAYYGAKINGTAGQIIAKTKKESMLASDIMETIGLVRARMNI